MIGGDVFDVGGREHDKKEVLAPRGSSAPIFRNKLKNQLHAQLRLPRISQTACHRAIEIEQQPRHLRLLRIPRWKRI